MISDDIVRASSSRAPEAGPAASALALIAHKPGLSIRMLSVGVGLSHAATVRLVDRLSTEGLVERREHSTDGRTRSLHLTEAGKVASDAVLASRDKVIAEGLSILTPTELDALYSIAERVLRDRLENLEHSYRICRLCCYEVSLRRRPSDGISTAMISPTLCPTISSDPRSRSFLPRM